MNLKGANVFVTGGTGFVGSHLVEELIKAGANVVTTEHTHTEASYFFTNNFQNKAKVLSLDINDRAKLHTAIKDHETSIIFHLAAQPIVERAYKNPTETLDTNIVGTVNILEAARTISSVKGVLFASSDKAYGKLGKGKYLETDALRGDHPYEVSKSAADLICYSYFKTYGVPVVTTRFGNIYGEGDLHYSRIIPGIMKAIVLDETLELRSDGKHVRDYLYVKDVARGYIMLASHLKRLAGEAFNFGSPETLHVLDLLRLVEDTTGKKIKYTVLNTAKNEIPYQSLDYTKIKQTIGWEPLHGVKDTAKQILAWYESVLK